MNKLLKKNIWLFLTIFFLINVGNVFSQQDGPDKLTYMNGKTMDGWAKKEDSKALSFSMIRGSQTIKIPWIKIKSIKYGESDREYRYGSDNIEIGNWKGAIKNFNKILTKSSIRKWQKDYARFHIAIAKLNMGNMDEAKQDFNNIKEDSRWFFPAKLKIVDTLPKEKRLGAFKDMLKDRSIQGADRLRILKQILTIEIAKKNSRSAQTTLEQFKEMASKDKYTQTMIKDYQIKIYILMKKYSDAELVVDKYITMNKETGSMRIAKGDILMSRSKHEEAVYQYLGAVLFFDNNVIGAEAHCKAGKAFWKLFETDKEKNRIYKKYAKKEFSKALKYGGDSPWVNESAKLLKQIR